ncbi:MAG: type 1 glutamine amidotransferase [Albidovulum sp.]
MRVAIVVNTEDMRLGLLGQALTEARATVTPYHPRRGDGLPDDVAAHDALVVMGGEQSARDDLRHPYLPDLAELMRRWTFADKAVLGICLGSQLLARGHGADNHLGEAREFGWRPIRPTEIGRKDPVISALGEQSAIFQWHGDTFALPDGAVHLAKGDAVAHQAFRIGRAAYGTQFHFEAGREVVADWTATFADDTEAMQPGWTAVHPSEAERHGPEADAVGLAMSRAWIAQIQG